LETEFAFCRRIFLGYVVRVGRCNPAFLRVVYRRHLVAAPETVPFVTAIARHWQQAIPIWTLRRESARHPADVSILIRIYLVQGRRAPIHKRLTKRVEVLRAHVLQG